jgi:hypothetical protein
VGANDGLDGKKGLRRGGRREAAVPPPLARGPVGVLGAVRESQLLPMCDPRQELGFRSAVALQLVGHEDTRDVRQDLKQLTFGRLAVIIPHQRPIQAPDGSPQRPPTFAEMTRMLLNEHHIAIFRGLDELKGRISRVGHMGKARHADYIVAFLGAVRAYLETAGFRSTCRGKSCLASTSDKPAR